MSWTTITPSDFNNELFSKDQPLAFTGKFIDAVDGRHGD